MKGKSPFNEIWITKLELIGSSQTRGCRVTFCNLINYYLSGDIIKKIFPPMLDVY